MAQLVTSEGCKAKTVVSSEKVGLFAPGSIAIFDLRLRVVFK